MIKQPNELDFRDKKFSMILYGAPGVGKTTLALSAPKPVLIDFDRGISRVKAYHRQLTIVCNSYDEVLHDIEDPVVKNDCETIIIDTGGSFITFLQAWAIKKNPALYAMKDGKTVSLKGFGAVKAEFNRFTGYIKDTLNKNLIYVFHAEEKADKDGNPVERLLCEGAAKNIVWQPCDFGGYVQMVGDNRVVCFTPTSEFFAKGCFGIEGAIAVPELTENDKNNFITKLFEKARANITKEAEAFAPVKTQYDDVMKRAREIIEAVNTADDANEAIEKIKGLEHALTSKKEASSLLNERCKKLGYKLNKETKQYEEAGK